MDGRREGDLLDGRLQALQVQAEHRPAGVRLDQLHRATGDVRLAVEAHVGIAAHLAASPQKERGNIQIGTGQWAVADGDRQRAGADRSICAGSQCRHALTAAAAWLARSLAVRPWVAVPTAVRFQPDAERLR
ncbi:hypothetical protein D3C85_1552160 [compost metagenome]